MLVLDGLGKRFGPTVAVADVRLGVARGQMVGVIGRSGAGKSTLLRLINRLVEPTSGRVLFAGEDVSRLRGAARGWRARCAMIFQQFNLVGRLDVLTNVLSGTAGAPRRARAALPRFTAEERARAVADPGARSTWPTGPPARGDAVRRPAAARRDRARPDARASADPRRRTDRLARPGERGARDGDAPRHQPAHRHHGACATSTRSTPPGASATASSAWRPATSSSTGRRTSWTGRP